MEENRFANLKFGSGLVKSGSKVTGGVDPVIRISSTYNGFVLSPAAQRLLNVAKGDTVVLYDMLGVEGANVSDHYNDRFYISKGFKKDGVEFGAIMSERGLFTLNIVWGAMMAQDMEVKQITGEQLVKRELAIEREVKLKSGGVQKTYIALQKGVGMLKPINLNEEGINEPVEVLDGVAVPMYAITDIHFNEHTPRIGDDGTDLNDTIDDDVTPEDNN